MSFSKFQSVRVSAAERIIETWISEHLELFQNSQKPKRMKRQTRRVPIDYWQTPWGQMLMNPNLLIDGSHIAKVFRLRFRIPFLMFRDILMPMVVSANIFPNDAHRRVNTPTEFKVLASLRILGRGNCCDDISEMSMISPSSCNRYFNTLVTGFVSHFYRDMVRIPTGQELADIMEMYSVLGFPGAMGSMDATHVRLGKCPHSHIPSAKGKEGTRPEVYTLTTT